MVPSATAAATLRRAASRSLVRSLERAAPHAIDPAIATALTLNPTSGMMFPGWKNSLGIAALRFSTPTQSVTKP